MKPLLLSIPFLSLASAFVAPSHRLSIPVSNDVSSTTTKQFQHWEPLAAKRTKVEEPVAVQAASPFNFFGSKGKEEPMSAEMSKAMESFDDTQGKEGDWVEESKKVELILLSIWLIGISGFILENNFVGPWPLFMKTVPERVFFLSHMIGGMLFGGGIILTTCIERLVSKSKNAPVLQFWFDKVPFLDGLIVVPALTVSMISGTGLSIVRYGGLNIAPPHVGAIFWTLLAFMAWWGVTDLTTQGAALEAVNEMYEKYEDGESPETPKVVVDRHVSNVVSCFFVLLLYSFMVLKPGTLFPFPWNM